MFFSLYKYTDDGVFNDFPKISEDFPKLLRRPDRSRTFSENFREFPKIAKDFRGRPEDVSMIHQRIEYNLKDKLDINEIIDIFTCEDIISSREDIVSFLST